MDYLKKHNGLISHLSPSGFRKMLVNPALYAKRYLLGEDSPTSIEMVIGSAIHTFLEDFANGEMEKNPEELIRIHTPPEGITFKEGGTTLEDAVDIVGYVIRRIPTEWDALGIEEIIATEEKLSKYVDMDEIVTNIPLMGIVDLVYVKDGKVVVGDYKTVKQFSSLHNVAKIDYKIQGHFYMYLVREVYREMLAERDLICETAEFIEIKKPKPGTQDWEEKMDGKPMVNIITVEYDHKLMVAIAHIVNQIFRVVNGAPLVDGRGNINALPNIYDMMSGQEALEHYQDMLENPRKGPALTYDVYKRGKKDEPDILL